MGRHNFLVLSEGDIETVTQQLGHTPRGAFEVVVRDSGGKPVVIRNAPRLYDGTPMPTLYWLTGPEQIRAIGQLESSGGVNQAEADVDPDALQAAHDRYAAEREALFAPDDEGMRPYGGVAGTRRGVKCLHAHYAYLLAGGDDPVGRWVAEKLRETAPHQ
jgi:hypothetical protein